MEKSLTKNNLQNISNKNYPNKKINKNILSKKTSAYKINEFSFKKTDFPPSFEDKNSPLNTCNLLKKERTLKSINNIKLNNKIKLLNTSSINKGSNKFLLNYSYSHSLNKKELNNSLNNIKKTNIKKNMYSFKDKIGKNNFNAFSNIINFKKISLPLKKKILEKNKLKNKTNIFNKSENMKINNYFNENTLSNSNEEINYNFSSTFINDNKKHNKFNTIDNNNLKNYGKQFKPYNSLTNEAITKDKYYLLKKKYNILLEENQLYKTKVLLLQKENKKLKKEISSNKYNELFSKKMDINEIKKLNDELKKQNTHLKEEVKNLKIKINELIDFNKRNILNEKILEEIPLEYFESFFNILGGLSIPSTERYIKKLEKENSDLSNELTKYKNLFLSKNN